GASKQAQSANNYFGLECTEDWIGASFKAKNECFRQYESAWTSFRDHSLYITTGRFSSMNEAKGLDAQAWINLLSKTDFYENKKHPKELKAIMEKLDLSLLDQE
ncbi:MAG: glucosaminidase domain-containing protein, partial [Bacteroidota bacterium]